MLELDDNLWFTISQMGGTFVFHHKETGARITVVGGHSGITVTAYHENQKVEVKKFDDFVELEVIRER